MLPVDDPGLRSPCGMTSLDAWSSIGCQLCIHHAKKKLKKKIEVSILGWLSNYHLWHCNAFFCFVWLHSLLFLESLVPFLISPYNRIVNLELIKFAAKLLPLHRQPIVYWCFLPSSWTTFLWFIASILLN